MAWKFQPGTGSYDPSYDLLVKSQDTGFNVQDSRSYGGKFSVNQLIEDGSDVSSIFFGEFKTLTEAKAEAQKIQQRQVNAGLMVDAFKKMGAVAKATNADLAQAVADLTTLERTDDAAVLIQEQNRRAKALTRLLADVPGISRAGMPQAPFS